ncbi:MAG: hypothetical protein DRP11_01165 [Candidatus Aenigmatarchaeota archaeon]|mgnify:CR=1 FL=1|nr:MAG: hypothetical protein DRP11_01165 [Candidatus Aenigmarchaeota archaeon]
MDVTTVFLLIGSIITIGFFANAFFRKTKIPDLIWLLLLGLILGPVMGIIETGPLIDFIPAFSALALLIILFDAGLNMNVYKLIREVPRALLLALLGFGFSAVSVALITYYFFSLSFLKSLLLGSIVGGVSSAIVIPIVSSMKDLREEPALIMDIESALTDPLCIVISLVLMGMITKGQSLGSVDIQGPLQAVASSFSISLVIGFIAGLVWLFFLQVLKKNDYYYMLTLAYLFFVYPAVETLGGNGAIASLMIGIVLGNGREFGEMLKLENIESGLTLETKHFHANISFFVKTFFFVTLGALIVLQDVVPIILGVVLSLVILVTRFIAVRIASIGAGFTEKEKKLMTYMLPRGLAAAVLASMPFIEYHIEGTQIFTQIVFAIIITTAIISTLGIFHTEHKKPEEETIADQIRESFEEDRYD